ncbi:hypothetical protein BX666DRAFT_2110309 [Dichotomocladium elegans]|nr:hypothetical protein BX666DRAFT_2110309 [Dichotomocladium elegans]
MYIMQATPPNFPFRASVASIARSYEQMAIQKSSKPPVPRPIIIVPSVSTCSWSSSSSVSSCDDNLDGITVIFSLWFQLLVILSIGLVFHAQKSPLDILLNDIPQANELVQRHTSPKTAALWADGRVQTRIQQGPTTRRPKKCVPPQIERKSEAVSKLAQDVLAYLAEFSNTASPELLSLMPKMQQYVATA